MSQKVMPNDNVTVYGTGKSKYMKTGKAYEVHKLAAERLVKAGHASYEAGKESNNSKNKKEV